MDVLWPDTIGFLVGRPANFGGKAIDDDLQHLALDLNTTALTLFHWPGHFLNLLSLINIGIAAAQRTSFTSYQGCYIIYFLLLCGPGHRGFLLSSPPEGMHFRMKHKSLPHPSSGVIFQNKGQSWDDDDDDMVEEKPEELWTVLLGSRKSCDFSVVLTKGGWGWGRGTRWLQACGSDHYL